MALILGLDFETTGSDPASLRVIEIGGVLYDTDLGKKFEKPLSLLVWEPGYPKLTQKIKDITNITDEMLEKNGWPQRDACKALNSVLDQVEYVMCHNVQFDRAVYEKFCSTLGLPMYQKEWICSYQDVPYPEKFTCKKLSHLAFDHGMKMDSRILHRAVDDVHLMLDLVFGHYKWKDILAYHKEPWVYVKALVEYEQRELAKKEGYGWEVCRGTQEPRFVKSWVKRLKQGKVEEERARVPFQIKTRRADEQT